MKNDIQTKNTRRYIVSGFDYNEDGKYPQIFLAGVYATCYESAKDIVRNKRYLGNRSCVNFLDNCNVHTPFTINGIPNSLDGMDVSHAAGAIENLLEGYFDNMLATCADSREKLESSELTNITIVCTVRKSSPLNNPIDERR